MKLFLRRGDHRVLTFEILEDDSARDISSDFIRFTIKRDVEDLDSEAIVRLCSDTGGVIKLTQDVPRPAGTLGQFQAVLTYDLTEDLEAPFVGVWDVQHTLAGGQPTTPLSGTVEVEGDVTRNPGSIATDV